MKNIEFIKAGAGSGKTYTLTEKLSEKIAGGQVKASEVLLTTFTTVAAAEVKARARAFLLKSGLTGQAKELEQASIGTVHSVALKFIKRYWYKLGIGTDIVELNDDNKSAYIQKSLSECVGNEDAEWFGNFEELMGSGNSYNDKNKKQDYSPLWQKKLKDLIEKVDMFDITDFDKCKSKSKEMVDVLFPVKISELGTNIDCTFIKNVTNTIKNYSTTKKSKKALEEVNLCKEIIEFIDKKGIDYQLVKKLVKMLGGIPGGQDFFKQTGANDEVEEMKSFCESYKLSELTGNILKEYIDRMFSLVEKWSKDFKQYKVENNLIDFNDMERLFVQLLEMPEVRDEMKDQIKLVMVDEFQDSNAKQIKIFNYLSEIAEQSIWVGDAKQAIYGFRGSDTEQTKEISDQFNSSNNTAGLTTDTLKYSWRSVPSLVHFSNDIFKISFESVISNPNDVVLIPKITSEVGNHSLFEWSAIEEKTSTGESITPLMKIAWKVKGILDRQDSDFPQGYKPSDIAILCRDNDTITKLATILKSIGVPVSESGENILDYAEVQLVRSVLKYALDTRNDHAMAEILHLLYGISTEEILDYRIEQTTANSGKEGLSYNWEKYSDSVDEIDRLVEHIKYLSLPDMVKTIIIELDLLHKSGKWQNEQKRMDNLFSLIGTAEKYDSICMTKGIGSSINGFLAYLNEQKFISGTNTDENCVTVATYHKAKGLEWKLVILNELNKDIFEEIRFTKRFLFDPNFVRDETGNYIQFVPTYLASNGHFWGTQLEDVSKCDLFQKSWDKILHEQNRLLYVGMTRAKENLVFVNDKDYEHVLWLHYICDCNPKINPVKNVILDTYDNNVKKVAINSSTMSPIVPTQKSTYLSRDLKVKTEKLGKQVSPSKAETADVDLGLLGEPTFVESSGNRITINSREAEMNEIGTCIHNIFAVWNPNGDHAVEVQKANQIIAGNRLNLAIPEAEQVVVAAEFIYRYLTAHFGKGKMLRELPFKMKKNGRVFSGEMDLVWATDEGCVLLDYKNFPGSRTQFMDKQNADHYVGGYKPQLCLYKEALQTAGKKVLDTFIYYSVIGDLVKF